MRNWILLILIASSTSIFSQTLDTSVKILFDYCAFYYDVFPRAYRCNRTIVQPKVLARNDDSFLVAYYSKDTFLLSSSKAFIKTRNQGYILLYDYNLGVGDTFRFNAFIEDFGNNEYEVWELRVDSIANIKLGDSISRRQWHFSPISITSGRPRFESWIEGLGSEKLDWNYARAKGEDGEHQVLILCKNKEVIYSHASMQPSCDSTYWQERVSVYNYEKESITIHPNPVQSQLQIEGLNQLTQYQIYSLTGQLLQYGSTNDSIDVQHLKSGLYMLYLIYKGVATALKFRKE